MTDAHQSIQRREKIKLIIRDSLRRSELTDEQLEAADLILLLVKHTEFVNLRPNEIASKTESRVLVDCVNGWNSEAWKQAGFQFHRLGDSKSSIE